MGECLVLLLVTLLEFKYNGVQMGEFLVLLLVNLLEFKYNNNLISFEKWRPQQTFSLFFMNVL